jgi:hypothetical protein
MAARWFKWEEPMDAASRRCHPERSEGSVALCREMLRGVYTEQSECAQHDNMATHAASRRCHPERSEGSVALGMEMLRGVYTERSECAQHDSAIRLPLPQGMVIGNFLG